MLTWCVTGSGRHVDMVCYGLGSFVEAHIARYQLALMTALRDKFQSKVPFRNCEVYDPIFITEERTLLQELGFTVLMTNEEGKRMCRPDAMTVFYLPHCGKALYNNLLWANWGPGLQHIIVIGNSFTAMTERTPFRILQSTAKYVANIQPYTKEQPLTIPDQFSDVFNDTSVHSFPTNLLDTVRDALWDDNAEPVYTEQDAEIIFKAQ
ncbi:SRR1-like protein isoform X2 [Dreissena polymorpha]|uniref:SRR1-like protein isoform X2 n=1 Tax=Dreissena polymorpha TaxID=45954 RepID=UPI00226461A6|nr:SRR1-like protein isoform X2 [Dreissena polymorpha]